MLPRIRDLVRFWPWGVLILSLVPAVLHFVTFETDLDGEYPGVARPTFSPRPPAAFRLAEPGDTIDRVALYASAVSAVFAAICWSAARRCGLWAAAMVACLAAGWYAATPGPCYDGWHGLGWRAVADSSAPFGLRLALAVSGLVVVGVIAGSLLYYRDDLGKMVAESRRRRGFWLFFAALIAVPLRFVDVPAAAIPGYWPRWAFAWGMLALGLGLIRMAPAPPSNRAYRVGLTVAGGLAIWGLIAGGITVAWYHRPLERLRAVVPGKVYISAMPTYRGLEVEQNRLHFKTIINIFPEETYQRSPILGQEMKFVAEHGLRYLRSPGTAIDSDTFLDETLRIAQDPNAWPVLIHCHGCMDRSPAWMGVYRFVVQGVPLRQVLREIECHRGCRPKASVTLLYNRVLRPRSPQQYDRDPTAKRLRENAAGTEDPYEGTLRVRSARGNPSESERR